MKNELREFMLFTYFSIEPSEKDDIKILVEKCAYRAYLDMNRTLRYHEDSTEQDRKLFCDKMCEMITEKIVEELHTVSENEYDEWHGKFCQRLIEEVRKYKVNDDFLILRKIELRDNYRELMSEPVEYSFYYGQAQKWINMTVKYVWMIGCMKDVFENIESVLHIPVDSYIIEAIWHENREENKKGQLKDKQRKMDWYVKLPAYEEGRKNKYSNEKVVPWSRWSEKDYINFQKELRDYTEKKQVKWECENWIRVAKKRR